MTSIIVDRPRRAPDGDADLLDALEARSPLALGAICERYRTSVHRSAQRVVRCDQTADEIAQEVFLQLWLRPERYDQRRGGLGPYLTVVARGRAIDWLRAETARRSREERLERAAAHAPPPGDTVADRAHVRAAIASLSRPERDAIWLVYYLGHTHAEVAEILHLPLGTAKSRIRSALHRMAIHLAADPALPAPAV